MVFDLKASTDAAMCAIFDPAALTHLLELSWEDIDKLTGCEDGVIEQNEHSGNLSTYSIASDGTFRFRFYVDDDRGIDLRENLVGDWQAISGFLLKIPSGKLCAAGYEYLPQKELGLVSIADYDVGNLGQCCRIPPGNYKVYAYNFGRDYQPRSVSDVFNEIIGRGEPRPRPHAIYVMCRMPDVTDISRMHGDGFGI